MLQLVLLMGIALTCTGCAWLSIITHCHLNVYLVVISAVLLGAGCAVLLVSSIAMATQIIGQYSVSSFLACIALRFCPFAPSSDFQQPSSQKCM